MRKSMRNASSFYPTYLGGKPARMERPASPSAGSSNPRAFKIMDWKPR